MSFTETQQQQFVRLAMSQAAQAAQEGCPPFGVVLVNAEGEVVAATHNTASVATDMTCHAEVNLIRFMAKENNIRKLTGYAVFINAASCTMCAAALIQSGIRDFYYGTAFESHTNPAASYEQLAQFVSEPIRVAGGILADECTAQIQEARKAAASA